MPAKTKLSPKQRQLQVAEENRGLRISADNQIAWSSTITKPNGTKINGGFMIKVDGTYWVRYFERRSRKKLVMKWRQI